MQNTIGPDDKREPEDTEELQEDFGPDEDGDWTAPNPDWNDGEYPIDSIRQ